MINTRFEIHSHTDRGSNIRLLDSINKVENLINYAVEIGLRGICITDHECLAAAVKAKNHMEKIKNDNPDFKLGIGNEIYLVPNRESGQRYYHFILIAKNKDGYRALKELSSRAHMLSYYDRSMERVPTTYDDLSAIVKKYPNSLIATTACLGGELSVKALQLNDCERVGDTEGTAKVHNEIVNFMLWCKKLFGSDFYVECAPGCSVEQIVANKRLKAIAAAFDVPMVIGSDAHYLRKSDRYVHEAYLNSKGGERETAQFYEYAYLQTQEEIYKHLSQSFVEEDIDNMLINSMDIYNKIEDYSIKHKQTIPRVEVKNYEKSDKCSNFPVLNSLFKSDDIYDRYWVNECFNKLEEKGLLNKKYLDRLEEEADIKQTIGNKLETNMFSYPITLQHYIDMFWECGSIVGAGRGSSCSGLNHYLLGITQLDPLVWGLPFWRYLNKERVELGSL